MPEDRKVNAQSFYGEFHGHKVRHLRTLLPPLRESSDILIWTAGDSSLDNKYWFADQRPATGAYGAVLDPPISKCDVTYWINFLAAQQHTEGEPRVAAINAAVEATTLNERSFALRAQDRFLRDNIKEDDVLIVSIGGNDIAMLPMPCTIVSMAGLLCLPTYLVQNAFSCCALPCNDCCCGCGTSLLSCCGSCPPCWGYIRHLFGVRTKRYIEALTSKTRPKKILVCMIYYPDENPTPSWAGAALGALGYNSNPSKIQSLIRKAFEDVISLIRIPGSEVISVPLFHVLDGRRSEDYVARVEPSALGGRKMAEFFLDTIRGRRAAVSPLQAFSSPSTSLIQDRS